jgi:hypothetical protein
MVENDLFLENPNLLVGNPNLLVGNRHLLVENRTSLVGNRNLLVGNHIGRKWFWSEIRIYWSEMVWCVLFDLMTDWSL